MVDIVVAVTADDEAFATAGCNLLCPLGLLASTFGVAVYEGLNMRFDVCMRLAELVSTGHQSANEVGGRLLHIAGSSSLRTTFVVLCAIETPPIGPPVAACRCLGWP